MRSTFVLATTLLAASLAVAQTGSTVAELKDVQGQVLVAEGDVSSSATDGLRVAKNVSITTTARAGVTVVFDSGCRVTLKESQRLVVDPTMACEALIASVGSAVPAALGAGVGAGGAAAGGLSVTTLAVAGGLGVGALIYANCRRKASPSGFCS